MFTANDQAYLELALANLESPDEEALADFLLGSGVWNVEDGQATFYPASEHPNVIRGYN